MERVLSYPDFLSEFRALPRQAQEELVAATKVLEALGPTTGRPNVDTLKGSSFSNMKELRFQLDGLSRFAFAFDPQRNAIVLCGGDKYGEDSEASLQQTYQDQPTLIRRSCRNEQ